MILQNNILYGGDLNYKIKNVSFGEFFLESIRKFGHRVSLIDGPTGKTLYYDEIVEKSFQTGYAFRKVGFKKGDIVAVCMENRIDFAFPVMGGLIIGLIISPINPIYNEREMLHALNILQPRAIVCSKLTLERCIKVSKSIKSIANLIVLDIEKSTDPRIIPFTSLLSPLNRSDESFPYEQCNPREDVAFIFFSSGTTGMPKGVMLTHRNFVTTASNYMYSPYKNANSKDTMVSFIPFFHCFGCNTYFNNQLIEVKMVIMPRFEFETFLQMIEKYRGTLTTVVPPICILLAKSPLVDRYNLSSLRQLYCGAAPLPPDINNSVVERLKTLPIRQGYGMTELTLSVTMFPTGLKTTSVGKIALGIHAKVLDLDTQLPLGPGKSGELCFKGEIVMKGYYKNQEATNSIIDSEGWLHTGDVGYYDENGFIYIVDRLKELIKYKAYQVAPAELESIILEHKSVKDVAVIGIPDESAGEVPLAFVVKQPNVDLKEEEIVKFVADRVSPQKRLYGGVRFIEAIPKNPSGKILRKDLKNLIKTKSHL